VCKGSHLGGGPESDVWPAGDDPYDVARIIAHEAKVAGFCEPGLDRLLVHAYAFVDDDLQASPVASSPPDATIACSRAEQGTAPVTASG
jgi:hypothetical protein